MYTIRCILSLSILAFGSVAGTARAVGYMGVQGIRMVPENQDAETYSRPGWGGALMAVGSASSWPNWLCASGGIDFVNLLSDVAVRVDSETLLRTEVHTDQYTGRLFLGPEVGPRGRGLIQPYATFHLALVLYTISATLVIPDDSDPENSVEQDLGSESNFGYGYDFALGLDLNIRNKVIVGGGARYVKSFGVPQQLEEDGSVTIHPDYVQAYVTLGFTFDAMAKTSEGAVTTDPTP